MSPQQFIDLVCRMRSAQRQELRTLKHGDMQKAEQLEREVDQALRDFSNPNNQLNLFSPS